MKLLAKEDNMGKYVNPVVSKLNKLKEENEKLKGTEIIDNVSESENLISIDSILNEMKSEEKIEIELIDFPRGSKITGMAQPLTFSARELGMLSIKYSDFNSNNDISKTM